MDLITSKNNDCDYKIRNSKDQHCDFVLVEAALHTDTSETPDLNDLKSKKKCVPRSDYEKMLYFVCNLCPYLCIKDSKITEHLESVHRDNKTNSKPLQLKCPACPNIFYHNISLKSHLIHDHKVASSDLHKIVRAVMYYAKKSHNNVKTSENKSKIPAVQETDCKNEMELVQIEKLLHSEKIINNDHCYTKEAEVVNCSLYEDTMGQIHVIENSPDEGIDVVQAIELKHLEVITLPLVNIAENNLANILTNSPATQDESDILSKLLDHKMMHRCTFSQCKVCMVQLDKLDYHIKCHIENTFKCPECTEVFAFWKPLATHLWRMHKIDMELYSCDKCWYKTPSLAKLNNSHKLIHSDLRAYECDDCKKKFKNMKQLRNHKVIHKNKIKVMDCACSICSKTFADKRQLNVHMDVVHKKIRPFLCSYCGYKGASRSALKMHTRQHTGEKPFSCDVCEYTTADHNSLRRHKLRHTGQKPYKCTQCNYACIQTSTYKEHIRTKHPSVEKDFVFTCKECQFRSVNQEMYSSHLFLVHQQKL